MSESVAQPEIGFAPPPADPCPLQLRFDRWLRENPHVEGLCVEIARELKAAAQTRISMDMVFHVARYRLITKRAPGESFVWNNSYASRMSRLLAANYPDLATLFETRRSRHLDA